ncbi:MAG: hypothetical protein M5U12_26575 [Verrucomicrobia bacterium]|nr:hypothetical protein [Verrucomicrobiota bacterium]
MALGGSAVCWTLVALVGGMPWVSAEDGAKPRAYLHFRAGEISPQWGSMIITA